MNFLKWLYGPIQNFWDSFKIAEGGNSLRKEMAFGAFIAFIYANYKVFSNPDLHDLYIAFAIIDACFIALCVGLVTAAELIKFKNGSNENTTPVTNTGTTTS